MTDWPNSMMGVAERVRELDRNRPLQAVVDRLLEIEREKDGYLNPDANSTSQRLKRMAKPPDGVACFNFMYLRVTQEVLRHVRLTTFQVPAAIERLAVVFAEFYLVAYGAAKDRAWISKAWAPIVKEKDNKGIVPLQFAIAGMNAHINNDLIWALLQVWDERGFAPDSNSPEYADFDQVNTLLAAVQEEVRGTLERGIWKVIDRLLGRTDDVVAQFVIARAREEAWDRARAWIGGVDDAEADRRDRDVAYQTHLLLTA
jgi:Family of unknown function (DUF5995)